MTTHTATIVPVRTVARATLANVMLVGILACVAGGLYLLDVSPAVIASAVVAVGVLVKVDDARIRRARRRAAQ